MATTWRAQALFEFCIAIEKKHLQLHLWSRRKHDKEAPGNLKTSCTNEQTTQAVQIPPWDGKQANT